MYTFPSPRDTFCRMKKVSTSTRKRERVDIGSQDPSVSHGALHHTDTSPAALVMEAERIKEMMKMLCEMNGWTMDETISRMEKIMHRVD